MLSPLETFPTAVVSDRPGVPHSGISHSDVLTFLSTPELALVHRRKCAHVYVGRRPMSPLLRGSSSSQDIDSYRGETQDWFRTWQFLCTWLYLLGLSTVDRLEIKPRCSSGLLCDLRQYTDVSEA